MAEQGHMVKRWLQQEGEELLYAPDDMQAQNSMLARVQEWTVGEVPLTGEPNPFFSLDLLQQQQAVISDYQQRCLAQWTATASAAGEESVDG